MAPPPAPAAAATNPPADADFPFAEYLQAQAAGQRVLRVAPELSLVAITVRRGGTLARLGHDHVVAARHIEGFAAPGLGRAALRFRLEDMTVDEAGLRAEAGLATQPSVDAISGTRNNMLTKVLEAERHPWLVVHAERLANDAAHIQADITLHGVTRRYLVKTVVEDDAGGVRASGTLAVKQSDFGITPFSVLGGALAVQDQLELRFAISAR